MRFANNSSQMHPRNYVQKPDEFCICGLMKESVFSMKKISLNDVDGGRRKTRKSRK